MQTLRIKIEIPQKKGDRWNVYAVKAGRSPQPSKKRTVGVAYAFVERKLRDFLASSHDHKTAIYVKDGTYYNEGEYTDLKSAMYALTCFLEDHLTNDFRQSRYKKYYTGL